MIRRISIGWLKQRSGMYALKGITISEDDHDYDSSNTFRDQDAEWVTITLNAQADVELSGRKEYAQNTEDYPKWAAKSAQTLTIDDIPPITRERANATLLRHILGEIVTASGGDSEDEAGKMQKLLQNADALLRSTDCGTYYSVDEALSILTRHDKKPRQGASHK